MVPAPNYQPNSDNPIDDYVLERIRFRVRSLVGRFGFRRCDEEDLQQEMILHILQATPKFDETKGSWATYVNRVLDKQVRAIILKATHQLDAPPLTDVYDGNVDHLISARKTDEGLALDIHDVIQKLPDELREVCEQLKCGDFNQTARALRIHHRTLRKRILLIRQRFEEAGINTDYLDALAA